MDILSTLLVLIGLGFGSVVVFFVSRKILRHLFKPAAAPASTRFAWVDDPADANRQARPRTVQPTGGTKRQEMYQHMREVGPELRRRHGAQRYYRPQQVREVMTDRRSNRYDNDCYSYATYCTQEDFNDYHRSIGESCDYGAMRQEICQSFDFLPGGAEFDAFDIFDASVRLDNFEVAGGSGVEISDINQSNGRDRASNDRLDWLGNADLDCPQSSLSDDAPSQDSRLGADSTSSSGSFWSSWGDLFSSASSSSSSSSDSSSYSSSDSSSSYSSDSGSSSSSDSSSSSSSDY
jgi:hypothetical protein